MTQTNRYFVLLMPCFLNGLRALQLWSWIPLLKLQEECILEPQWQHFLCCSSAIILVVLFLQPFTCCRPQECFRGGCQGKELALVTPSFPSFHCSSWFTFGQSIYACRELKSMGSAGPKVIHH